MAGKGKSLPTESLRVAAAVEPAAGAAQSGQDLARGSRSPRDEPWLAFRDGMPDPVRDGLLHEIDGFVFATRAAVRALTLAL